MMKCPKCGYERQSRDNQYVPVTECPACGIVYAKSEAISDFSPRKPSGSSFSKPSPVDEESLRKARERVELRLRKQLEARVYDEKHAQTLQRARLLTSQAVAMRRSDCNNGTGACEALTTDLDNAPPLDSDSEPLLELVEIVGQECQTQASPDHQLDPVPDQSEAASAAVSTQPPPLAPEDLPAPEEKSPATGEIPDHTAMEPQDEKKQLDEPVPEDALQTKEQMTEDEAQEGAFTLDSRQNDEPAAQLAAIPHQVDDVEYAQHLNAANGGLARIFSVVAWVILLAGVIGAFLSWTTLGHVQADMGTAPVARGHLMPIGLLLGFAYLATGVLGFAFFWVSSLINRQLKDIRQILLSLTLPIQQAEHENASPDASCDEVKA